MKYFFFVYILAINFVYGSDIDKENASPESANRRNIHSGYAKIDPVSRQISELEMARNRYTSFVEKYDEELNRLEDLLFFEAGFADENEEVMNILHGIFSNKAGGENWHAVTYEFKNHPLIFLEELNGLKDRIKMRTEESNVRARELLDDMSESFFITQWMVIYYWNNKSWFLGKS